MTLYHQCSSSSGINLPDYVLSRIGIYADDTTLYSSLGKSVFLRRRNQLVNLIISIVEWGDRWLATFNATETKLLSFNRHRDPLLVHVEMNGIELPEETSFRLV